MGTEIIDEMQDEEADQEQPVDEGMEMRPDDTQQEVLGQLPPPAACSSNTGGDQELTELTGESLGARPIRSPVAPIRL